MGGIWGALTWQGKALVVGVVLLVLLVLGLTTRHGSGKGSSATSSDRQTGNVVTAPVQTAIAGGPITGAASSLSPTQPPAASGLAPLPGATVPPPATPGPASSP